MGNDDLFKKRRADRKKRSREFKIPKANSYLIVTEGECTEPHYFKGLRKRILESIGGNVEVLAIPEIDIHGEGTSTEKLIEITEEHVSKANVIYQNIWVIFDRDDFPDFDEAIKAGNNKGYKIGWSNQSFEYWLFLHFNYSDSDLHRQEWNKKLDVLFKEYRLSEDGYEKNYENLYEMLDSFGGVDVAIRNAKRRMSEFSEDDVPSLFAPGTTVHILVEELKKYLE